MKWRRELTLIYIHTHVNCSVTFLKISCLSYDYLLLLRGVTVWTLPWILIRLLWDISQHLWLERENSNTSELSENFFLLFFLLIWFNPQGTNFQSQCELWPITRKAICYIITKGVLIWVIVYSPSLKDALLHAKGVWEKDFDIHF